MQYSMLYASPLGQLLLAADDAGLTGAWFADQKYFARGLAAEHMQAQTPVLTLAARWLDVYFSGSVPDFSVPLHPQGTQFQQKVWQLLSDIPYGQTVTYGFLASRLAEAEGRRVSAQAVGGAVGHNPVSIFIPCHRVVGSTGSLTGYAGGLERKTALLKLEGAWENHFFLPGTAR